MKKHLKSIVSLLIIYAITSCAGSKKIDFNTAYKFSSYNYQKYIDSVEVVEMGAIPEPELYASTNQTDNEMHLNSIAELEEKIYEKMGISINEGEAMETEELKDRFSALSRKEKREIRKDIKTELKQLSLEAENAHSTLDTKGLNDLSELTRWSVIIGSVGLVLLILGAIFTGFLIFFGAIFVVGAAVLFIIDQA